MHETSCRRALFAGLVAMALSGCAHADPCHGVGSCPAAEVCGLGGACVPRPTREAVRFVEVRELRALARGDAPERLLLGADGERVELLFGPLPRGRLVSAVLRLSPHPAASRQADGVADVRRGRRRAEVRYAIGRDAPLLVDVSELLEGAEAGEIVSLSLAMRAEAETPFEASSPRSADPSRRPTLTLVLR